MTVSPRQLIKQTCNLKGYLPFEALLLLFYEKVHSISMIKHAMIVAKNAIEHLNSGQIQVITMDQPLYALAKQIQWSWSEFDEKLYIVMLGGLHIEMAVISMMEKWLDESGWCTALVEAGITTPGKAEAFLSASHVKRTRYAHQVTVACLHVLQNKCISELLYGITNSIKL